MVRKKKKECWHKFLEEHGSKDPWEVARMAKNPWGNKQRMKALVDNEGNKIEEKDQGKAMENAYFLWDPNKTNTTGTPTGPGDPIDELLDKTYKALAGTSNTSAPGPDGISYKILKAATNLKTTLGSALMLQVATSLSTGSVPMEWQQSKVVFIPKPGKDHTQLKSWRSITLINCIGKLGEKVVADKLQEAGLLHGLQFGSVKNRSAIDTVFREVTRVQ